MSIQDLELAITVLTELVERADETNKALLARVATLEAFITGNDDEWDTPELMLENDNLSDVVRRVVYSSLSVSVHAEIHVDGE